MINLHPANAIWLVEENEVAPQFVKAVATVRTLYKNIMVRSLIVLRSE